MSTSQEIRYTCPYCGREFDITIYPSVNGDRDPELRDLCLSGDIFRHSCPHCHMDFMVQNEMLYTDSVHKFAIWLSKNEVTIDLKRFALPLAKAGWKLRRCATLNEFTEKISIFEDGLDDIAVELAKYDSFIEFLDSGKGGPKDVKSVEYQRTEEGVMKINVRTKTPEEKGTSEQERQTAGQEQENRDMSFLIPLDTLMEEMKADADLFAIDETTFPCINGDWIISLYLQPEGRA